MIYRFFSHRIAWLALIVSLGIGALFVHTMWSMRKEHWDYQLRTNTNLSSTLAKGLEWSLDAVDLSLQKTAIALRETQVLENGEDTTPNQALLDALWRDINNSNLLVLDNQGRIVHRAQGVQSVGKQFLAHDFFQAFRTDSHHGVFIGRPTKELLMGEYVLPVARAVRGKYGLLTGVVVGTLRMQDINAWLSTMNLGQHSGVNVIRDDGLVLTRFPYQEMQSLQSLAGSQNLAHFLATPQGNFVGTAVIDGVQRLYTHNKVGHYPLLVNVAQSTQAMLHGWARNAWQLGAFALLLMLSCLGLAIMFTRELARRESMEADLFTEKERMRLTLQSISDAVICTDAQGRITYLNPVAKELTGWTMDDARHQPVEIMHVLRDTTGGYVQASPLRLALESGQAIERARTTVTHRFNGERVEMEESASPVISADGVVLGAVAVLRDVTVTAAREARMQRLAFHDVLTGLPNRLLLQDRALQAIAQSKRTGDMLAVVYLDLDRFKQINDSLGHHAGDAALVHAAKALQACVRESDTVCRLGGDEFVVLLPALTSEAHLMGIAQKIQQACALPFTWDGKDYVLHASGGVALYPVHAVQWDALLHCADAAMYAAKKAGRHQIRLYQPQAEASLLVCAEVPEDVV